LVVRTGESIIDENGVEVAVECDFVSATKVDINVLVGGKKGNVFAVSGYSAGRYDYTYSKPNVAITIDETEILSGSVNGDKMTLDGDVLTKW
jgi:hypothetical protein